MPYEFRGENLVYVEPPEVSGYTWTSSGGGADTAPTERWERNADFDPNSILDIKTDKYGRTTSSLKADASEADKRAYNLSRNFDPSDFNVATEMSTGISPDWENVRNSGWWDIDPAIQAQVEAANQTGGGALGLSARDWITPAMIIAGGLGTAAFAPAAGAMGAAEGAAGAGLNQLSTDALIKAAMSGAGKGALMNGAMAAIQGRDPLKAALTGAATGGIGGAAGSFAGQLSDGSKILSGLAGGAAGAGSGALINGSGNAGNAALIGGLTGGITGGLNDFTKSDIGSALSPATRALVAGGINGTPSAGGTTGGTTQSPASSSGSSNDLLSYLGGALGLGGAAAGIGSLTGSNDEGLVANTTNDEDSDKSSSSNNGFLRANTLNADTTGLDSILNPQVKMAQNINMTPQTYADGGEVEDAEVQEHNPEFFSEGGLNSLKNSYVQGDGDGTSDSVPAMLANGEFVIPADVVSSLGNGSNDSGSKVLGEFLSTIREHKQKHGAKKLPPDSKGPLAYLTDAKRKVKA